MSRLESRETDASADRSDDCAEAGTPHFGASGFRWARGRESGWPSGVAGAEGACCRIPDLGGHPHRTMFHVKPSLVGVRPARVISGWRVTRYGFRGIGAQRKESVCADRTGTHPQAASAVPAKSLSVPQSRIIDSPRNPPNTRRAKRSTPTPLRRIRSLPAHGGSRRVASRETSTGVASPHPTRTRIRLPDACMGVE